MSRGETLDTIGLDEHKPEQNTSLSTSKVNNFAHSQSISLRFTESDSEMTASEVNQMSSRWCHFHVESY